MERASTLGRDKQKKEDKRGWIQRNITQRGNKPKEYFDI